MNWHQYTQQLERLRLDKSKIFETCTACNCEITIKPTNQDCSCKCHKTFSETDKFLIRDAFRKSSPLKALAEYYATDEEKICEILGLPRNKQARDKIHRDQNYYDHGFGPERIQERQIAFQSYFLKTSFDEDGDFEKFQPCCYMERNDPEFIRLKAEAEAIPKSDDPISEVRRLWILNRFTEYQGPEWAELEARRLELMPKTGFVLEPHLRQWDS